MKKALGSNGYIVFDAPSAEKAVEIFNREDGQVDLLFSDVVLPDKSGLQLADILFSLKPDIKIIMTSGYADQKSQRGAIQEKGYFFLEKTFTLSELFGILKKTLED